MHIRMLPLERLPMTIQIPVLLDSCPGWYARIALSAPPDQSLVTLATTGLSQVWMEGLHKLGCLFSMPYTSPLACASTGLRKGTLIR